MSGHIIEKEHKMFEIFPTNYVWNLPTNLAMCIGAPIGEIEVACRPIMDASTQGDDTGTEQFFRSWTAVADKLGKPWSEIQLTTTSATPVPLLSTPSLQSRKVK